MTIYIVLYIFLLSSALISLFYKKENNKTKFLLLLLLIFVTLIAGTRYKTGVDFYSYLKMFKEINQNITEERLFVYGVRFFKLFFNDLNIFLVVSVISAFFLYKTLDKNLHRYKLLSIYIYITYHFFPQNMGQIRLSLAIILCLSSLYYVDLKMDNKKRLKVLSILVAAMYIHRTAAVFFISFFIVRIKKITKRFLTISLIISCIVGKFMINKKLICFSGILLQNKKLMSMLYEGNINIKEVGFSYYQILILGVALFLIIYNSKNKKILFLSKLYLLGCNFYFLFINLTIFSSRFSNILLSVDCLLYPLIINDTKNRYLKIGLSCFVIFIGGYIYFKDLYKVIDVLCPYKSWLFRNL